MVTLKDSRDLMQMEKYCNEGVVSMVTECGQNPFFFLHNNIGTFVSDVLISHSENVILFKKKCCTEALLQGWGQCNSYFCKYKL